MLVGEFICGVERREEVVVLIEVAQRTRTVIASVRDKLHLAVFIAQAGKDAQTAERQGGSQISGTEGVVALIVVAAVRFLKQI